MLDLFKGLLAIHQSNAASLNAAAGDTGPVGPAGHSVNGPGGVGPSVQTSSGTAPEKPHLGSGTERKSSTAGTTTETTATVSSETTPTTKATTSRTTTSQHGTAKPVSEVTQVSDGGAVTDNNTDGADKPGQTAQPENN